MVVPNWILWNEPLYTALRWIAAPLAWPANTIARLRFSQVFPNAPEANDEPRSFLALCAGPLPPRRGVDPLASADQISSPESGDQS